VKEYYKDACLVGKIHKMKIPVLALNAEDDPFQVSRFFSVFFSLVAGVA
jgi:predicted alpha/beta-fold hydrolase